MPPPTKPELLLPAGDPEKLRYAIAYGADAVYLGLPMASLRTPSKGALFTPQNLGEHIHYAQSRGVKAYVTLNIFASNHDLKRLSAHLEQLETIKPDGLIVSDMGVFGLAKRKAPSVPLHVSTQANTLNWEACAVWQDLGASRVILAREVPLREMAEIHQQLPDLELECFVHGSLCVAYSGRCVISDYLTDNTKNSNKGMCGNSCRWELDVVEKNRPNEVYTLQEDEHGTYLINSRDLCLIRYLPELVEAGMVSFKVEGRTKGVHYVATVGQIYRKAIDMLHEQGSLSPSQLATWEAELMETAHRGFTEGFLFGKPGPDGIYYNSSQSISSATFVASSQGSTDAQGRVELIGRNPFKVGDTLKWVTPSACIEAPLTQAWSSDGFTVTDVHPNHTVWVTPPTGLPTEELRWILIRRPNEVLASVG